MLHAVIMAGGSGTRFWPLSRQRLPKQFLSLYGARSLLQQAFDRVSDLVGAAGVLVVTNAAQTAMTREQLPDLAAGQVVGEPVGRDTAPCIGLAAALLQRHDPEAHMLVLAADHLIRPIADFHVAVRAADALLADRPQSLVTFGVLPARPSTAYGYLRRDRLIDDSGGARVYKLKSFHEKPNLETARGFVESGECYWNSGIFCWRAETILAEIQRCAPELAVAVGRIADAWDTDTQSRVFADEYEPLVRISIDYAVMERSANVYMVEAGFEWDDVGSWLALERVLEPNEEGNIVVGMHRGLKTTGCIIVGDSEHLVSTLGVQNLIIVQTEDVTLVADRSDEQAVKQLIARLEAEGRHVYL